MGQNVDANTNTQKASLKELYHTNKVQIYFESVELRISYVRKYFLPFDVVKAACMYRLTQNTYFKFWI